MKGKIIVISGTDGSGKETQTNLLYEKLQKQGLLVKKLSFPNYTSRSSGPLKMYLDGELGGKVNSLDACQASILFATDRLCSFKEKHFQILDLGKYSAISNTKLQNTFAKSMKLKPENVSVERDMDNEIIKITYNETLEDFLNRGGVLLLDRYMESNLIHQACKMKNAIEREKFAKWITNLEIKALKLPKADLTIFLDMPTELSIKLANQRKNYKSGEGKDIHESDEQYLKTSYNIGKEMARIFDWKIISCFDAEGVKQINSIQRQISSCVEKFLDGKLDKTKQKKLNDFQK